MYFLIFIAPPAQSSGHSVALPVQEPGEEKGIEEGDVDVGCRSSENDNA